MVGIPRQGQFGFPVRLPKSNYTQDRWLPTEGFDDRPDIQLPPGSISSGANIWIWGNRLMPRPRLQQLGTTNPLGDSPVGAFLYVDVSGVEYPVVASKGTYASLVGSTWNKLTYVSGTSNLPPSGGINDLVFGASVYLPRIDQNVCFMTNGDDPVFAALPSTSTAFSTATQGLVAKDIALFDTRLMYWNVRYLSSASQLVTRVAWTVKGNPEDQTSIGAGFQDLFDMKGYGTRMFTRVDELMVATDQEIWRGRAIGPPFDFQFDPFSRVLGIPYPRAAINTPDGLFWVGSDFMVYRMQPYFWSQIEPVGAKIQRTLHNTVGDPTTFNFGYHADAKQLTLYYQATNETQPHRGFTLNTITGTWTPEVYQHGMAIGFTSPINSTSTQWNQLVGGFPANTLSYNQLLGASSDFVEATASSGGTVYVHQHPSVQSTDDGLVVPHEAAFGALFGTLPERRQFADTVRLDLRANSTSSLSVALSGDLGHTFPSESLVTISANSNTSFFAIRLPGIQGIYHTVRVRSQGGDWELNQGSVLARIGEEAF
jgi:hypothetical protein